MRHFVDIAQPPRRHPFLRQQLTASCTTIEPHNVHFELQASLWLDLLAIRLNDTSLFDRVLLLTIASLEPGLNASPDLCYANASPSAHDADLPTQALVCSCCKPDLLSLVWNVLKAVLPIVDRHSTLNTITVALLSTSHITFRLNPPSPDLLIHRH